MPTGEATSAIRPLHAGTERDAFLLTRSETTELTGVINGQRVRVPAGHVAAWWTGVPHRWDQAFDDFAGLSIALATLVDWNLPAAPALLAGGLIVDQPRPGDARQLQQWPADLVADAHLRRAALLEIQARLLRLPVKAARPPPGESESIDILARLLAEHHTSSLTIAEICRLAELNPNYAAGLFKRAFGVGLQEQLTRHRVATAKRLILSSEDDVLSIAAASGFGSQTRFYASFAKHVGLAPMTWREQMRNVQAHDRT